MVCIEIFVVFGWFLQLFVQESVCNGRVDCICALGIGV